ncbi:MAG: putative DNA binding domain-containing protein [Clostridiales bacterium]|jgi:ATP-dependent DNA helicase RecG|nr:putative DNA binding domain-containing protein [Clostridiales bacterium]MDR2713834.1 putative DNA binding domain-containing protein [Clostridiales bacterium]
MQQDELILLAKKIKEHKCEMQEIEVKAAEKGCPLRLYDTLSSFSNQDSGGVIVFGIAEEKGFDPVGVYDAQDLQKKVTEQCKQMEPVVRPLFTVALDKGKALVSAEIPGADIIERPVFYKGAGRLKGSYIRVGESDEQMSEYEIYSYEAFKRKTNDELQVLAKSEFSEVNQSEIILFLAKLRSKKPNLGELTDQKNLALSGIYSENNLTLAGLILFGLYPQALYPGLCITALVVPGYKIGDIGDDEERFSDNKKIEGTLPQMIDGAIAFIIRNMREKTIIDSNGRRADKTEYPIRAIREVVLNALIHRDYSIHTERSPVRILMFKDRIEVENPGGLYGRITLGNLGKIGADTRNPYIASNLEIMIDTENRFSGIPIIINEMAKAKLPPPVFENKRGVFKVTLYNEEKIKSSGNSDPIAERLLAFCQTPRTRAELEEFTGFSRYYTMSKIVQPLLDSKQLRVTLPDKPKSVKQMYIVAK